MPLEGEIGNLCHRSIGRMPGDRNLLSLDASLAIPVIAPLRSLRIASLHTGQTGAPHRSDRYPSVRPVKPTGQTGLELLLLRLRFFGLGFVDQPRNLVAFW
jgi:hypothetical protein